MSDEDTKPLLVVVSAPSGAGKTTLCERLLSEHPEMMYSVSCTTRQPRGDEVEGEDYSFLAEEDFEARVSGGSFIEHACVHGHRYGTLRSVVEDALRSGRTVVMDIDVQGAAEIRRAVAELPADAPLRGALVDIFIAPPSLDVLRERLLGRGEDSAATIRQRMQNAQGEMSRSGEYTHVVVNRDVDRAYRELEGIIREARKAR